MICKIRVWADKSIIKPEDVEVDFFSTYDEGGSDSCTVRVTVPTGIGTSTIIAKAQESWGK